MKTDSLKKLGILGVSFGLMASPLAFAEVQSDETQEPVPQEETMDDEQGAFHSADTDEEIGTEYEEEEQEDQDFTFEEEEEEEEWDTTEGGDDAAPTH